MLLLTAMHANITSHSHQLISACMLSAYRITAPSYNELYTSQMFLSGYMEQRTEALMSACCSCETFIKGQDLRPGRMV